MPDIVSLSAYRGYKKIIAVYCSAVINPFSKVTEIQIGSNNDQFFYTLSNNILQNPFYALFKLKKKCILVTHQISLKGIIPYNEKSYKTLLLLDDYVTVAVNPATGIEYVVKLYSN